MLKFALLNFAISLSSTKINKRSKNDRYNMFVFASLLYHFGVVFFAYNFGQGQNLTLCKKAKV